MTQVVEDPHLEYTKEQIAKNLILLEEHLKNYQCPYCLEKHLLAIEGYAEEGMPMSDKDRPAFIQIADWAQDHRTKKFDRDKSVAEARKFRESMQKAHSHVHGSENPGNPGSDEFWHERKEPPENFDPRSFRTVTRGKHQVIIGCPVGHYVGGRCKVGTRAQSILHRIK